MSWQIILKSIEDEEGRNDKRYTGYSQKPRHRNIIRGQWREWTGNREGKAPKANKMYMFLKRFFAKERTAQFDKMYVRFNELDRYDRIEFMNLVKKVEKLFGGNGLIIDWPISRTGIKLSAGVQLNFSDKRFTDATKINMINESGIDSIWIQMKRLIRRKNNE